MDEKPSTKLSSVDGAHDGCFLLLFSLLHNKGKISQKKKAMWKFYRDH